MAADACYSRASRETGHQFLALAAGTPARSGTVVERDYAVHLQGDWSDDEIRPVREAIIEVEQETHMPPVRTFGAVWVCVKETLRGEPAYFASRIGYTTVLRAADPETLAARIRRREFLNPS